MPSFVNWNPPTSVPFLWTEDVVFPYASPSVNSASTDPATPPSTVSSNGVEADISGSTVLLTDNGLSINLRSDVAPGPGALPTGKGAVQQLVTIKFSVAFPMMLRLTADLSELPYTEDAYVNLQDATSTFLLESTSSPCTQVTLGKPCHFDRRFDLNPGIVYTLQVACSAEINADGFPGVSPNTAVLKGKFIAAGYTFSPLEAVPASNSALKLSTAPAAGALIEALRVRSTSPVLPSDSQWIELGLTLPINFEITGIQVCYVVEGSSKYAYIAQTRLAQMSTPNSATVMLDDPTHRTSETPTCYTCLGGGLVTDTITLSLRVVLEESSSAILIGAVKIFGNK